MILLEQVASTTRANMRVKKVQGVGKNCFSGAQPIAFIREALGLSVKYLVVESGSNTVCDLLNAIRTDTMTKKVVRPSNLFKYKRYAFIPSRAEISYSFFLATSCIS